LGKWDRREFRSSQQPESPEGNMSAKGRLVGLVLIGVVVVAARSTAAQEHLRIQPENLDPNLTTLSELAARIHTMEYIPGEPGLLIYGTGRGFVYSYRVTSKSIQPIAKTNLWKGIKEVTLADLDGDHKPEVLVLTKEAMLYALTPDSLKITWSTEEGYFKKISCFTVADMEQDGKNEIILLADDHLFVFDIGSGYERWKSLVTYQATDMVAGDVDGDGMMELVLSDGTVLDSRLYDEEWIYETGFGHSVDLFDIDSDGILEVICLDSAGDIEIVDVDDRARKWK
jgi:hypothetical protein